jgi:hypothetical protein
VKISIVGVLGKYKGADTSTLKLKSAKGPAAAPTLAVGSVRVTAIAQCMLIFTSWGR